MQCTIGKRVSESYLLHKERCPSCETLGNDTSADNLAVYSDGHTWCYACGYHTIGDIIKSFVARNTTQLPIKHEVFLPSDSDTDYPRRSLKWMAQYELDKNDMMKHNILWSKSRERLIFPIFSEDKLLAYWGRYFGKGTEPKWKGLGAMRDIFHFIGSPSYDKIVLCEDIVSAIKLSKFCTALPLFGTHISVDRWKRLSTIVHKKSQVIIWLDPDMYSTSIKHANVGRQYGMNTEIILSDLDPKEHTLVDIARYLNK